MFAIFLSEKMDPFYEIVTSFPTLFFSVFLIFAIFYWCFAVLGLIDIDVFDFDTPDMDFDPDSNAITDLNVMAGVLFKLGLTGVPVSIVITFISLVGWTISFLLVYFIYPILPDNFIEFLSGIVIFTASIYISALITAQLIKPLRPLFLSTNQETQKVIIGQIAVVRSGEVTNAFGEAFLEDGGAGLIIKVRAYKDETFKRGDRVALLEYDEANNTYKVVSENELNK